MPVGRKLRAGRHSIKDLAGNVKERCKRRERDLSPTQRKALDNYRHKPIFNPRNPGNYSEIDILSQYFYLFDALFFGGELSLACTLKLHHNRGNFRERLLGVCDSHTVQVGRNGKIEVKCDIVVWLRHDIPDASARRLDQLSTMAHEMVHAYLDVYGCMRCIRLDRLDLTGKDGHGFAWQDALYAVKSTANDKNRLNLPLNDAGSPELVRTLNEFRCKGEVDISRWGFTKKDIAFIKGKWRLLTPPPNPLK